MKYSQANELKAKIMRILENAVDNMFDQIQANEYWQAHEQLENNNGGGTMRNVDLQPGYFDAKLWLDFPAGVGSNNKGFEMASNPTLTIKEGIYATQGLPVGMSWGESAGRKARKALNEKQKTAKKTKAITK
jgi:hypothetical protein